MIRTLILALSIASTPLAALDLDPEDLASCSSWQLDQDKDDPDAACFVPRTCAECRTDAECDALCEVKVCKKLGESGCWKPDRY